MISPWLKRAKKAASELLELQNGVRQKLSVGTGQIAKEIARALNADYEDVLHILNHLADNDSNNRVARGGQPGDDEFSLTK